MTIENMIKCCDNLTPLESRLAKYILENKEEVQRSTIQNISEKIFVSKSAIHRFCKKIGIDGFNDLKVRLAKDILEGSNNKNQIDVNFPFNDNDTQGVIAKKLLKLYEASIEDTYKSIDIEELNKCVILLHKAEIIDIYTQAHNMNVAENFQDKMRNIGRMVNCPKNFYEQQCTAIASKKNHVALILSYSGKATFVSPIVNILNKNGVKTILIGRVGNISEEKSIKHKLYISDKENLRNRISQFSSHIAMQYMLDVIYGCIFKRDYKGNVDYIGNLIKIADDREINDDK